MDVLHHHKTMDANTVFSNRFIDNKSLYLYHFHRLPSIHFISGIDGEKAYRFFKIQLVDLICSEHQYRLHDRKRNRFEFSDTVVVLRNQCIAEFGSGYLELLHNGQEEGFVLHCAAMARRFRERRKRKAHEINLIVNNNGLELKRMEIKRTKLDIGLFYEDDFVAVDALIQKKLNRKNDKGIVLLHGLPGTGKTTYLRYLIGRLRKRVLFLSPSIAGDLMNPDLIDMLIDNPETVLVIEDAENILMDRKAQSNGSVSNLLNISDGLLADFLNVQLVCTFNSPLALIDPALLRQGRLIASYSFGKLSVNKAQQLSDHLGKDRRIMQPMTLAEITQEAALGNSKEEKAAIGFRF